MEVSCPLQFNHLLFRPTSPPPRLCTKELRVTFRSSSQPLCAHTGFYVGCPPPPRIRNSVHSKYARDGVISISRKCESVSSCYLKPERFSRLFHDSKIRNPKKIPRYVVVRSELAGTGNPEAAYSSSDSHLGSQIRGVCFYAVTAFVAVFLFVLMVVAHPFVLLYDRYRRKAHHLVAKIWALLTVKPFFEVKFEGLENLPALDTPAVYVSNHQSFLDIYTLLTLGRSFKFISKTGIFLFPVVGWAMFLMGVIPLKRMDSRSQMECLKRCMDLVKKGASVFFFPEGTRSKDGRLGAFKKGAFSIAAKLGVPVVPITLIGTGKIMPSGRETILNPGVVKVIIHKPLEGSNPDLLCAGARSIIADSLIHES